MKTKIVNFDFIIRNFLIKRWVYSNCGVKVIGANNFVLYELDSKDQVIEKYGMYRKFGKKYNRRLKGWRFKIKGASSWRSRELKTFPSFNKALTEYKVNEAIEETFLIGD